MNEESVSKENPTEAAANTGGKVDIQALNEKIQKESSFLDLLKLEMEKVIVGQKDMIEKLHRIRDQLLPP